MQGEIRILPLRGIGEVQPGDDLVALLATTIDAAGGLEQGDILVVTQKIVSKAEGRLVDPSTIEPSPFAQEIARTAKKDARYQEVVLRESKRIVKMANGVLITETRHGLVCANSGVDESNVDGGRRLALLPLDPDTSAAALREGLARRYDYAPAVIITDTFGRPWREGQVNVAIGVAGMLPLHDFAGVADPYGYTMQATLIAVADELAAAAELVMGKIDRVPAAIIRGYHYLPSQTATARQLIRDPRFDLFR